MALRKLNYYKKYLHLDMAILLKSGVAYAGLIIGFREREIVFQVNQKILYRKRGQYNDIWCKISVLDIIHILPREVMVFSLGKEPPVSYLIQEKQRRSWQKQPIENILHDSLQGPSTHTSLDSPYFALPAENLDQELPENNGNSFGQTSHKSNAKNNGAGEELNGVDQEINGQRPLVPHCIPLLTSNIFLRTPEDLNLNF